MFGHDLQNTGHSPNQTGPGDTVEEQWAYQTDAGIQSYPSVTANTVYVGSNDNHLYAINLEDGTERWTFETSSRIRSSPAVASDTVYIGNDDGTVHAVNIQDGSETWSFTAGDRVLSSPTLSNGTLYFGSFDHRLYALDAETGRKKWEFDAGGRIVSTPALQNGSVFFGTRDNYKVYAVNMVDGDLEWSFDTDGAVLSSPALSGGTVYIGCWDNRLYALDSANGEERWRFTPGNELGVDNRIERSPAVADGIVYFGCWDHSVYAVDAESGVEEWRFQTDARLKSAPAIAGDTVYVGGLDGNVYGIDAQNGNGKWTFETGGEIWSSPAVLDRTLYIGSLDGNLYALTSADSTVRSGDLSTVSRSPEIARTQTDTLSASSESPSRSTSSSTPATEQVSDQGGNNALPIVLGLGLLGLGGSGALWWTKRDASGSDDSDRSTGVTMKKPDRGDSAAATVGSQRAQAISDRSSDTSSDQETVDPNRLIPDKIPSVGDISVDPVDLVDEQVIGGGGTADVTKALLPTAHGDLPVAIKRPRISGTLQADTVERMLEEAETWELLDDHDHIVDIIDYGQDPFPWIAMEYMDSGHLGERAGKMDLPQALWTALSITDAVHHAHYRRGVAHLDLKPENVLFRSIDGMWDAPKVADWGLSKHLINHSKSVEGISPQYAAPEQFDERYGTADTITDIYQLGAMFYFLFTGRPPFGEDSRKAMRRVLDEDPIPPSEVADVPEALNDILMTAMEKDKDDRYDSAIYIRDKLQELL